MKSARVRATANSRLGLVLLFLNMCLCVVSQCGRHTSGSRLIILIRLFTQTQPHWRVLEFAHALVLSKPKYVNIASRYLFVYANLLRMLCFMFIYVHMCLCGRVIFFRAARHCRLFKRCTALGPVTFSANSRWARHEQQQSKTTTTLAKDPLCSRCGSATHHRPFCTICTYYSCTDADLHTAAFPSAPAPVSSLFIINTNV